MECEGLECCKCDKELCFEADDTKKIEGHYNYDGEAYCVECWEKNERA